MCLIKGVNWNACSRSIKSVWYLMNRNLVLPANVWPSLFLKQPSVTVAKRALRIEFLHHESSSTKVNLRNQTFFCVIGGIIHTKKYEDKNVKRIDPSFNSTFQSKPCFVRHRYEILHTHWTYNFKHLFQPVTLTCASRSCYCFIHEKAFHKLSRSYRSYKDHKKSRHLSNARDKRKMHISQ